MVLPAIKLPLLARPVGPLLFEQCEWELRHRYLALEPLRTLIDNQSARLSALVS